MKNSWPFFERRRKCSFFHVATLGHKKVSDKLHGFPTCYYWEPGFRFVAFVVAGATVVVVAVAVELGIGVVAGHIGSFVA